MGGWVGVQAVVNEDAAGSNLMLRAELHRLKMELAAKAQGPSGSSPAMTDEVLNL